jgi:uncharacterized RDD family membrane protein YckC
MSDLVTGEAVALEMRLAKFPSRALAILIDLAMLFGVALGLVAASSAVMRDLDDALAATLGLVTGVLLLLGVPVLIETLTRGRSLGKLALGLRVVRDDGGPVRLRHALARGLAGVFVDFYVTFGVGAVVCSLLNERGKRVGDLLAGTVVIRERAPAGSAPLPPVPPELAHWATSLELSRLPDDLALATRRFLGSSRQLSPHVRDQMGTRLATDIAQFVTPPPPPGTPAWAYLTAVLGERSRRESERLAARTAPLHAEPSRRAPLHANPSPHARLPEPPAQLPTPDSRGGGFAPPA